MAVDKKSYVEEKKKEIETLINKIDERLKNHTNSREDIAQTLNFMTKFYQYSFSNSMLIEEQFRGAKAVGSFKFFSDMGFSIKKGEKGIKILVPKMTTYFDDENGERKQLKYATKEEKAKIKSGEIPTKTFTSFSVGNVFDVSQTNAKASDLPKLFPNRWLEGEIKDYSLFYRGMEKIAEHIGVKIIEPKSELGVAKGVSYTMTKEVALNPRNSELQNAKTLLHELAHAKLHTRETHKNYTQAEREFQAELVAFSVCQYFKIDTSEYSLNYLKNWTKDTDIPTKKSLLNEVATTTREYIEIIESSLVAERELEKNNDKNQTKEVNNITKAKPKRIVKTKTKNIEKER